MAVLIDPPAWPAHGRLWSHLVSDTSFEELHDFADRAGIPGRGFEGDHYDVPEDRYADVVAAGALPVPGRELLRRLRASGLRRPKRRGERVLTSTTESGAGGPGAERVDVILSSVPPLLHVRARHLAVLAASGPGRPGPWVLVGGAAGSGLHLPPAGDGEPGVPPVQVGYLRHVPLEPAVSPPPAPSAGPGPSTRPVRSSWAEVVLLRTVAQPRPDGLGDGVGTGPSWVLLDVALRDLPTGIAALLDEVARTRRFK